MVCHICGNKPLNCDCTIRERKQFDEIAELQEAFAFLSVFIDEELNRIEPAMERSEFLQIKRFAELVKEKIDKVLSEI
jgi:hypothetical protein